MQIEVTKIENIDEILKIEKKSFVSHWNKQIFIDELSSENGYYLSAIDENKIIGYTGMRFVLDEGHITTLAVHPKFRKKGVGYRLIAKLMAEAKLKGINKLFLEVRQSNVFAQRVYKKLGFKVIDRRREYYQNPREDALVMKNENI